MGGPCLWLAGLRPTDCLVLTLVSGALPDQIIYLAWDDVIGDGGGWVSEDTFNYGSGSGIVEFWVTEGYPHLAIDGKELLFLTCGSDTIRFAGGPYTGHDTGEPPSSVCSLAGTFVVQIACTCCPTEGWNGAGWYCIDFGDGCPGGAVFLVEADRCDTDIVICSGPYATEAEAQAACPTFGPAPTCTEVDIGTLPALLNWSTSSAAPCADGLSGTFHDNLIFPREFSTDEFTPCGVGGPQQFTLRCNANEYTL